MSDCCLAGSETATREYDDLIGSCGVRTQPYILLAGNYARGDILFKTGTAGELTNKAVTPASVDTDAIAIMPFDVQLGGGNDSVSVYVEGEFNIDAVTGATDIAVVKETFTNTSIRLRKFSY